MKRKFHSETVGKINLLVLDVGSQLTRLILNPKNRVFSNPLVSVVKINTQLFMNTEQYPLKSAMVRMPSNVDECGSSHDNENTGPDSHSPTHHKARQINRYRIHVEVAVQQAQHPKSRQHKSVQFFKMATEVSSLARVSPVSTF